MPSSVGCNLPYATCLRDTILPERGVQGFAQKLQILTDRWCLDQAALTSPMRKRRHPGGGLSDAVQNLRILVDSAAEAQTKLPGSTNATPPTLPPLPESLSALSTLNTLSLMSRSELEELSEEITDARRRVEEEVRLWDELGKYLKSALDAALMVISVKSDEATISKRRRSVATHLIEDTSHAQVDTKTEAGSMSENDSDASAGEEQSTSSSTPKATTVTSASGAVSSDELTVGRQVAFKLPKSAVDEWIQCEITRAISPGAKFEVRDPEPDEQGNPGKTYQARTKDIMPLALPNQTPKIQPPGAIVLARYPETTAFYKARVTSYNPKKRIYYLRFEGEEDAHKEIEVPVTLVLPSPRRR